MYVWCPAEFWKVVCVCQEMERLKLTALTEAGVFMNLVVTRVELQL